MGTAMNGWSTPNTGLDAVGDLSRQVDQVMRRQRPPRASQILGPGIAPNAVRVVDWNGDETLFNGFYYSDVDAVNSPDGTKRWMGTNEVTTAYDGIQTVAEMGVAVPVEWRRTFTADAAGVRTFTAWVQIYPSTYSVTMPIFAGPWATTPPVFPALGTPFTVAVAGVMSFQAYASAYNTGFALVQVRVFIDGNSVGEMVGYPTAASAHFALIPKVGKVTVAAGTHYIYFQTITGNSDANDYGTFFAHVDPA